MGHGMFVSTFDRIQKAEDVVAQTVKSFEDWDDSTHQEREDMRQVSSLIDEEQLPVSKRISRTRGLQSGTRFLRLHE